MMTTTTSTAMRQEGIDFHRAGSLGLIRIQPRIRLPFYYFCSFLTISNIFSFAKEYKSRVENINKQIYIFPSFIKCNIQAHSAHIHASSKASHTFVHLCASSRKLGRDCEIPEKHSCTEMLVHWLTDCFTGTSMWEYLEGIPHTRWCKANSLNPVNNAEIQQQ